MTDQVNQKLYQQVTRFVVNNQKLEQLAAKQNEFNPFKVLKISNYEIRHSNMLAWLLNPKETHLLRDIFLKKVIAEILCGEIQSQNHNLRVTDILLNDYSDAKVYREWRNIDLLVVSRKNDFVMFIENKVHSGLSKHQLEKYVDIIKSNFPMVKNIIPVFLTIEGQESPHQEYYSLSHLQILEVLKLVADISKEQLNSKIYDFINHYIMSLEEITMQDEELIVLCKEIYEEYKEAIDAIVKYGMVTNTSLHEAYELMKKNSWFSVLDSQIDSRFGKSKKETWFLPDALANLTPNIKRKWKSPYPIAFFFSQEEKRLKLFLEVGPLLDGQFRVELLNKIVGDSSQLFRTTNVSALTNINGKYTKIRTCSIPINDWEDSEHVAERMNSLLVDEFKYTEVVEALGNVLSNVDQLKTNKLI